MTHDHEVGGRFEPCSDFQQEFESPTTGEFAHCSDHRDAGRNSEAFSPDLAGAGAETVVNRDRNGGRRNPHAVFRYALEGRVGDQRAGDSPVEKTMVRIPSDVARIAKCPHQWEPVVDTGGDAHEVIVGEVANDDIVLSREVSNRPDVESKMGRPAFLEKPRLGPFLAPETVFKVSAAYEQQARVHPGGVQCPALQLGHRAGAGPLVGGDNQCDSHRSSIAELGWCKNPWQSGLRGVVCSGAGGATRRRGFEG